MKYVVIVLLWASLFGCSNHSASMAKKVAKEERVIITSPKDDRLYAHTVLENGLQAVIVSDPTIAVNAVSLSVGVGSFHNPPSQPGLAHYLEHMLFLGTAKYPEPDTFQKFVNANGGMTNAYTSAELTNYFFSIKPDKIESALDQFSDYFKAPKFDKQFSKKELNAVNSEWSGNRQQDHRILHRIAFLSANPEHPGNRLSVGNLETLTDKPNSKLHQELLKFYQQYYSANIMKLVIVGKQDLKTLEKLVNKHFSGIVNKEIKRPSHTIKGLLNENVGKLIYYSPQKETNKLYIEFPIKSNLRQWQDKSYQYISNLISSEEDGSPGHSLRQMGLIHSLRVNVMPNMYGNDGVFRIQIKLTEAGLDKQNKVISTVFAYLRLIEQQGIKEHYFIEYQSMLEKYFTLQEKLNPMRLAMYLSPRLFDYPVENILNANYVYNTFDKQRIKNVLSNFIPQNARIWHIYPQANAEQKSAQLIPHYEGTYRIKAMTSSDMMAMSDNADKIALKLPPQNVFFSSETGRVIESRFLEPTLIKSSGTEEIWLSNPVVHKSEKGFYHVEFNTPFGDSDLNNAMSSAVLINVLEDKLVSLSDKAYRAGLGIKVGLTEANNLYFELYGNTQRHTELAQGIMAVFKQLEMTEVDFNKARSQVKQRLENRAKTQPYQQSFLHMQRIMQTASWQRDKKVAMLDQLSVAKVQNYLNKIKSEHLLRVYAFGNYDKEMALNVAKVFKVNGVDWPADKQLEVYQKSYISLSKAKKINYQQRVQQADSAILKAYFLTEKNDKYHAAITVFNSFLSSEFYAQLRTNEQLGYAIGTNAIKIDDFPGLMFYVQSEHASLVTLSNHIEQFLQDYFEQLKEIGSVQFEQLKQSLLEQLKQAPNDFYTEANRSFHDFYNINYQFDSRQRNIEALMSLTMDDMIEVYRLMFRADNVTQIDIRLQGER